MKAAFILLTIGLIILLLFAFLFDVTLAGSTLDFHVHDTYYVTDIKSAIIFVILFLATLFFIGESIKTKFKSVPFLILLLFIFSADIYFYLFWTKAYND